MAFIRHTSDPQSFYVPVHMAMHGDKPGPVPFPAWLSDVSETEVADRGSHAWHEQIERWMAHSYRMRLHQRSEIQWLNERGHYFDLDIGDAISGPHARYFRITIPDRKAATLFALKCDNEMMPDVA